MLENVLEIFSVEEHVLFEDQSHEQNFLSLLGCVEGTSFENISYTKWKCMMITVANTLPVLLYKKQNTLCHRLSLL
jgi:hypothetical protein